MIRDRIRNARKNIRARYRKQCIGCRRHYHHADFCLHEGLFGRVFLCFNCAQTAEEDFFIYEATSYDILLDEEEDF